MCILRNHRFLGGRLGTSMYSLYFASKSRARLSSRTIDDLTPTSPLLVRPSFFLQSSSSDLPASLMGPVWFLLPERLRRDRIGTKKKNSHYRA